jgi:hypothetical protein
VEPAPLIVSNEHLETLIDMLAPFATTSTSIVLSTLAGRRILALRLAGGRKKVRCPRPRTSSAGCGAASRSKILRILLHYA